MPSRPFTRSSGGRGIEITDTLTPGQLIDASTASKTNRYTILATNRDTVDRKLTIEFGEVDVPDDVIEKILPANTLAPTPVSIGLPLSGTSKDVRAYAEAASVITIFGEVDEY